MSDDQSLSPCDASVKISDLFETEGGRMYQLALRFCGDPDQAEDLVQEVFLQAYRGWAGFRGESDVKTWLYRIAARACQRMHRRRTGEPEHMASMDAPLPFGEPLIAVIPDEQGDVLQQQIKEEARERLEAEIARLPDDFRVPLVLKEIVGLGVQQVAEVLGLEQGTVRSRLHRARLKLRHAIDPAIPRTADPAPPPAYDQQTCMDLLEAKQYALDRGVPFASEVICQRCRSVFAELDLAQSLCAQLANGDVPPGLRQKLANVLSKNKPS
jgi:RNA polymerase sigma-70 factor (ECF subfamily)